MALSEYTYRVCTVQPFHLVENFIFFNSNAKYQATPDKISQLLQKLIDDRALLKAKQMALGLVRQDLLYGYGSPLDPDPSFQSRVADHVLAECAKVMKHAGKYRRFKDPKKSCVTKDSPAE